MLKLSFSTRAGRIIVGADLALERNLYRLRSRFGAPISVGPGQFELEIDDFLTNLYELTEWPEDDEVDWQPELKRLVETNFSDAELLDERIGGRIQEVMPTSVDLGTNWRAALTGFQIRDLAKIVELKHGANFSVPGAGKTRVGLGAFEFRRARDEVKRLVVICPKSAFESWKDEVAICYGPSGPAVTIFDGSFYPKSEILLLNYERLVDAVPVLTRWLIEEPTLLVLDEAHRTKLGSAGAWGSACLALAPFAANRLILTGTPAPNGAKDLENLFSFVWPGQGKIRVQQSLHAGNLRTASAKLKPLFVRTTKSELNLPPTNIHVRQVSLPPHHRELYDALIGQYSGVRSGIQSNLSRLGKITLYLLMAATSPALLATGSTKYEPLSYQLPPIEPSPHSNLETLMHDLPALEMSPKLQEVIAIVARNASEGRKTLVWSTFVRNLTTLSKLLARFSPALIHGGTKERTSELARFRSDPYCLVLLTNAATLGEGVSLHQECHDAVYVDRDFSAGRYLQSLDRIHRLGLPPKTRTNITILSSRNTIDEIVNQRLAAKLDFMGRVLDDPSVLELAELDEEPDESAGLNADDIKALLNYLGP